jgi:hypothetical protein
MSRADCDVCDEYREKLNKQIDTLKTALISERELRIVGSKESKCYPHIGTWAQRDRYSHDEAKDQLVKEYPEINWEE